MGLLPGRLCPLFRIRCPPALLETKGIWGQLQRRYKALLYASQRRFPIPEVSWAALGKWEEAASAGSTSLGWQGWDITVQGAGSEVGLALSDVTHPRVALPAVVPSGPAAADSDALMPVVLRHGRSLRSLPHSWLKSTQAGTCHGVDTHSYALRTFLVPGVPALMELTSWQDDRD